MYYEATWGEGYTNPHTEVVEIGFFGAQDGYDLDDLHKILLLKEGETADLSDPSGAHTVTRLYELGEGAVCLTTLKNWEEYMRTGDSALLNDIKNYKDLDGVEVVVSGVGWERRLKVVI